MGYALVVLYMFIVYSRILDITVPFLHIPLFLGIAVYVVAAITGGLQRAVGTMPGKLLLAITALMMVSSVFGIWRGGSLEVFFDLWLRAFPFFFVIVGFGTTPQRCLGLITSIALGVTVLCTIALVRGDTQLGRLVVSNSRYGDPNDLALVCILALALWALIAAQSPNMLRKIGVFVLMAPIAVALLKTGSRGGFVGLALTALFVFWRISLIQKIKFAMVMACLVMLAFLIVPRSVMFRYTSIFSDEPSGDSLEEQAARGSTQGRMILLEKSLILTLHHPLLGVGPGNFAVAENDLAVAEGKPRGSWHQTHNMYTQWSSEVGIPALICCIFLLGYVFRSLNRVERSSPRTPEGQRLSSAAFWINTALVSFSACGFFLSVAYVDILPILSGLGMALVQTAGVAGQFQQGRTSPLLAPRVRQQAVVGVRQGKL